MSTDPDSIPLRLIPQSGGQNSIAAAGPGDSYLARCRRELMRATRAHSLLGILVLAYWAITMVVTSGLGTRQLGYFDVLDRGLETVAVLYFTGLFIAYVIYVMAALRPSRLSLYLWKDLLTRILTMDRLFAILPPALLLPILISSYANFKRAIPLLNPYSWDPTLANLGRLLYGGRQFWEWLQPLQGYPSITWALNFVYNSWFFVFFGVMFWVVTSMAQPRLRMQYLVTGVLQWALLGSLLATLMSSVGPAFYGRLTGGQDPYAPLMHYLRLVDSIKPLWAIETQDFLWRCHVNNDVLAGCGISAMPSMHVATAFSFALFGFAMNRWLGIVFFLYCALIFVGSVHLAWHYASDGYVGIIGTYLIWRLVGWVLERQAVRKWLGDTP